MSDLLRYLGTIALLIGILLIGAVLFYLFNKFRRKM